MNINRHGFALLASCAALILSGCGGGSTATASDPKSEIARLEAEGKLPVLDRSNTLAGPDVNANGIRDDIEKHIEAKYTDANLRRAVTQFARAYQAAVSVDKSNKIAVKAASVAEMRAVKCLYRQNSAGSTGKSPARIAEEISGLTSNTKERLLAYVEYSKALHGSVLSLPEGDTCE